jgi:voltage-gated potassium channel Kch
VVIYALIAILFAQLYSIAGTLLPGCFAYPPELAVPSEFSNQPAILPDGAYAYFSFVTIATLGYGDIAPRHPVGQVLASIEAIIGQFYVAIVVARLMSLYAAARGNHE